MLTAAWLPAAHLGTIARPALRLGGEWAGWRCAFDPFSGAVRNEVQGITTERWESKALRRRSALLLPGDDGGIRWTSTGDADWSTLPVAVSGSTSLMPGARSGLFGAVQVDMLNANAWALDEAVSENSWRCESVFDGLGGERQRAAAPGAGVPQFVRVELREKGADLGSKLGFSLRCIQSSKFFHQCRLIRHSDTLLVCRYRCSVHQLHHFEV